MRAGPIDGETRATCPSGMLVCRAVRRRTTDQRQRLRGPARRVRDSGASRTVTSRVSPDGSIQSPASMPANAGRSACATWPTVMPSEPARPRSTGRRAPASAPSSTARRRPRRAPVRTVGRDLLGQPLQLRDVGPLQLQLNLLLPPAKPVEIDAVTPASGASSRRISASTICWLRSRSAFGFSLTKTLPASTASLWPPMVV